MGVVWSATHQLLGMPVAIKLQCGLCDQAAVEAFLNEARAAVRVRHAASVGVHDFGLTEEGTPYIVMDLVGGETLAHRLARDGPLEPEQAVRLALPLAAALRAAHRRGVIHRDIKPSNIMVLSEGQLLQPKLLDFGIAALADQPVASEDADDSVVGTPSYMSPEQALGEPLDHRTDIWSFCVVLWEMLVGRPLFHGPCASLVLESVAACGGQPLPRPAKIDGDLWSMLERGLSNDPSERWESFDELGTALARWLLRRGHSSDASGAALTAHWPVAARRRRVHAGDVLVALVLLAGAVLGIIASLGPEKSVPPGGDPASRPPAVEETP